METLEVSDDRAQFTPAASFVDAAAGPPRRPATEATGTVADPDGGTLAFEVDQGPLYVWTYGVGCAYSPRPWLDVAIDVGSDTHGGWYVALVPVYRF